MFLPIKGGSTYTILDAFDIPMQCYLPPVGHGRNELTGEIEKTDILKRSSKPKDQYWEREELPDWYETRHAAEEEIQETDPDYLDPECEKIRERHWGRRLRGVWFWNNGKLIYLTGRHWFYLNWWCYQGEYMKFRIPNLERFYFLQYCYEDPNCLGDVEITKRKDGKCFIINTPIRMYDGSIKMVQDVKNNELVMGDDSTPRIVGGTTAGRERMYKIIANKGESFTCNESHILAMIWNGIDKPNYRGWKKGDKINMSVLEYVTLKQWEKNHLVMYRRGWGSHFSEKKHIIDPYMLGVYLGDGSSRCGSITGIDVEVLGYVREFAESLDLKLSVTTKITYRLAQKGAIKTTSGGTHLKNWKVNPYRSELRRLDILGNKHIPAAYLLDSEDNRLALLAGIIDTDGYLEKLGGHPKKYEVTQKNIRLADDIVELARSLGFFVSTAHKDAQMVRKDGSIYKVPVRRVYIYGDINRIPCKVKRKIASKVHRRKDSLSFGFRIEPIGEDDYYGFTVDKNNLFLLADGTVVHNTARAACNEYEYVSRSFSKHGGIQSKGLDEAYEVFMKGIITPFTKLPHFFKPIYDTSSGDIPKKELRFFPTSKRGKKRKVIDKTLESWIDFKPAGEIAYDGPELHWYISDECGKLEKVSILERHRVVQFCSEVDGKYVGFHDYVTTVEEMESGNTDFLKLVQQSHRGKLNLNGRTISGLYAFFMPAYRTMFFDDYGYPDEEAAKVYYLNTREAMKDDPQGLSSFIRKNPFTLREAFRIDGDDCMFNSQNLNEQLDWLSWHPDIVERGNFQWKDGERFSEVIWEKSKNGRWMIPVAFKMDHPNFVHKIQDRYTPMNNINFRMGVDPYKYDKTKAKTVSEKKKRSDCAAFAGRMYDPSFPSDPFGDALICRYRFRAPTTGMANEDMLKMAWYFGCQILFESNVDHWKAYFIENKCEQFLMKLPGEDEYGVYSDGHSNLIQSMFDLIEDHVEHKVKKLFFKETVEEFLSADPGDMTKNDETVAAGVTFIAMKRKTYRKPAEKGYDVTNIVKFNKVA